MKKSNDTFNLVTFFKKLFAKSIPVLKDDIGIYHYTDYQKSPTNYCGTDISWPSY